MPSTNTNLRRRSTADEHTPLLASLAQDPVNQINDAEVIAENGNATSSHTNGTPRPDDDDDDDEEKPLPMGQIFVLCLSRLVDPISFFCIFPFVPKMVETMNVREEEVGFYTGIIESLASVTQMLTMVLWGKAADHYGRKPVLVLSNFAVAIFTVLFGTSRTVWQMILFRCLSGSFTGSIISVRTMIYELSTPKTTARAFSYFAFAGNLGIFLGPAIGSLARPAEQYPNLFGKFQFFHDWPYILPTAIVGVIGCLAALSSAFFLKETLNRDTVTKNSSTPTLSTWELLKHKGVPVTLLVFSWSSMLGFAFTALCPVYFYTSVHLGGFGLPENLISLFISVNGISQALWLLIAFAPLHKRLGTKRILQWCGVFWPVFMLTFPLNNYFLRQHWVGLFWTVSMTMQCVGSGVAMAFTACQLAVNEAAPSPELLGTLNGIALTIQPGIRAIAPTLFSSIYAAGVKNHILWGQLGILVVALLASGFYSVSSFLPDRPSQAPRREVVVDEEHANGSSAPKNTTRRE